MRSPCISPIHNTFLCYNICRPKRLYVCTIHIPKPLPLSPPFRSALLKIFFRNISAPANYQAMNQKFSLAILLALAVLLAPTSAKRPCTLEYKPVCCWKSSMSGPPMTEPNECECSNTGGFPIFPLPCGPERVPAMNAPIMHAPAAAFARMPVAAPVAAPAAPSVKSLGYASEYEPVCCVSQVDHRVMPRIYCNHYQLDKKICAELK